MNQNLAADGGRPGALPEGIPLVELHTHLEGAVTPERLIALADKYGQPTLPAACLTPDGRHYRFAGFAQFLELFRHVTLLLRTPADYHIVARDLADMLHADGVVYCEVAVAYGVMQKRKIEPLPVQAALAEAAAEVAESTGLVMRWLPDAVRQFGVDAAWRALESAVRAGRELGVVGFGLGGDEAAAAAEPFAPLCADARREGLGVSLHAGEVAGPASVRAAVEVCGATRIGHGVAAAQDTAVVELLRERGVCIEMCPGSNLLTGAVARPADHPLREFLNAGLALCLNTDDRALCGLDLTGEYAWAAAHADLTREEAVAMQQAALTAAFCATETRCAVAQRLTDPG